MIQILTHVLYLTGHVGRKSSLAAEPEEWQKKNLQSNVCRGIARLQVPHLFGQVQQHVLLGPLPA